MKKFVGKVNGTDFNDEEEFRKAAKKAMKEGGNLLDISYYYEEYPDPPKNADEGSETVHDNDNFVHTNEYFLGSKEPDEVAEDGTVRFNVPDELVERIKTSINKDSIKKKLEFHLGTLGEQMSNGSYKVDKFKDEITEHKKKIDNLNEAIKEVEKDNRLNCGKYNYYYNLLVAINKEDEKEEPVEEKKEEPVEEKKEKPGDSFMNMTVFDFLKHFGLIK